MFDVPEVAEERSKLNLTHVFSTSFTFSPYRYVGMPGKCNFSWDIQGNSDQMVSWEAR